MKKIILSLLMVAWCGVAQAQCVPLIKNVYPDPSDILKDPGNRRIIVETEYTLNGVVVQEEGRNRFLNISGDDVSIITQAKNGIDIHCKNLIKRIDKNRDFIIAERQKRIEELKVGRTSENIILNIKNELIGYSKTITQVTESFKGKDIKVTYDEKNTVTNSIIAIP